VGSLMPAPVVRAGLAASGQADRLGALGPCERHIATTARAPSQHGHCGRSGGVRGAADERGLGEPYKDIPEAHGRG
jgi:hypothetical protein